MAKSSGMVAYSSLMETLMRLKMLWGIFNDPKLMIAPNALGQKDLVLHK